MIPANLLVLTLMAASSQPAAFADFKLDITTQTDPALQQQVERIDASLREKFGMMTEHTAVGVLDLSGAAPRLALINPDRETYAASVPKIGILLAYFARNPDAAAGKLDPAVRKELGEMIKVSSNAMAAKYSREIGLANVQAVRDAVGRLEQHGEQAEILLPVTIRPAAAR